MYTWCQTHLEQPQRLSLSWNDCLGNTFHCSFLQVFFLAIRLSQISHKRNIDYLDAIKLSVPERKAGKNALWRLMLQQAPQAWSFLMDPRGNKGIRYKQSEIDMFVLSSRTCVRIVTNTNSNWNGKVDRRPSVFGNKTSCFFRVISIDMFLWFNMRINIIM